MNAIEIVQLLGGDIQKAHGDQLIKDVGVFAGMTPAFVSEVQQAMQETITPWNLQISITNEVFILSKPIHDAQFAISISCTGGKVFVYKQYVLKNIFENAIVQRIVLGTSAKDVSTMLKRFAPQPPNQNYALKKGMQGVLALTIVLRDSGVPEHSEQMDTISEWCTPNNFCITSEMHHNFLDGIKHDLKKFFDDIIQFVERENQNCSGVVVSSAAVFFDDYSYLVQQLRERGLSLYACDIKDPPGEVTVIPVEEFAKQPIAESLEAEANSAIEQTRVGIDQLELMDDPGEFQFCINIGGISLEVFTITKAKVDESEFFSASWKFYGPDGRMWMHGNSASSGKHVISHLRNAFNQYENKWKKLIG